MRKNVPWTVSVKPSMHVNACGNWQDGRAVQVAARERVRIPLMSVMSVFQEYSSGAFCWSISAGHSSGVFWSILVHSGAFGASGELWRILEDDEYLEYTRVTGKMAEWCKALRSLSERARVRISCLSASVFVRRGIRLTAGLLQHPDQNSPE